MKCDMYITCIVHIAHTSISLGRNIVHIALHLQFFWSKDLFRIYTKVTELVLSNVIVEWACSRACGLQRNAEPCLEGSPWASVLCVLVRVHVSAHTLHVAPTIHPPPFSASVRLVLIWLRIIVYRDLNGFERWRPRLWRSSWLRCWPY